MHCDIKREAPRLLFSNHKLCKQLSWLRSLTWDKLSELMLHLTVKHFAQRSSFVSQPQTSSIPVTTLFKKTWTLFSQRPSWIIIMALEAWATLEFPRSCKQDTWNLFQWMSDRSEEKQSQFFDPVGQIGSPTVNTVNSNPRLTNKVKSQFKQILTMVQCCTQDLLVSGHCPSSSNLPTKFENCICFGLQMWVRVQNAIWTHHMTF